MDHLLNIINTLFQNVIIYITANSIKIVIYLAVTILVLIGAIILILMRPKMNKSCKRGLSGAYLNYASTNAPKSGALNPSDIAYAQNSDLRSDVETLKNQYRKLVNAPLDSKVIFNSGASESIANCIFWAKSYNQFGTIVGTKYDHSAVKANCDTMNMKYTDNMSEKSLMDNCALVMLTQVNSRSGEILNVDGFHRNFMKFSFMNDNMSAMSANNFHPFNDAYTLQYRPIIALDASQSIGKVPIYMDRWGLNAVFFSLHKLGGPMGLGVLIVSDTVQFPFKPLISGSQQMSLRGGTLPMQMFVDSAWVVGGKDDANERRDKWESTMNTFKAAGLKVYEPTNKHLYNTFLICVNGCPMKVIGKLAGEGIYVGNVSACKNEEILNKSLIKNKRSVKGDVNDVGDDIDVSMTGGDIEVSQNDNASKNDPFANSIRISYTRSDELSDYIIKRIIKACKWAEKVDGNETNTIDVDVDVDVSDSGDDDKSDKDGNDTNSDN